MHRTVLESPVYAKFAAANTVEVVVTEEMGRALREKNPLIKTYRSRDPYGDEAEYLVKFPGLTIEDLRGLSNSKAVRFISPSRRIPYTGIIDPHTGEQMEGFTGVHTVKEMISKITRHARALKSRYGKGIERSIWKSVTKSEIRIDVLLGDRKIFEANDVYEHLARETVRQPTAIRNRVEAARESILEDAGKRLEEIGKLVDNKKQRRKLARETGLLVRVLTGTPLEKKARALLKGLE